jgi:prepilin-type N-terminal cleavage/methylation domain-containing protein
MGGIRILIQMNVKYMKYSTHNGFTLMEILTAIFVFSIVVLMVTAIFVRSIGVLRTTREIQDNLENAQTSMNFIAKTLRTSRIVNSSDTSIEVLDFSQGRCFEFTFDNGDGTMLQAISADAYDGTSDPIEFCEGASYGAALPMNDAYVQGEFVRVIESEPGDAASDQVVGFVTISMEVYPPGTDLNGPTVRSMTPIQTSVSLRDYYNLF